MCGLFRQEISQNLSESNQSDVRQVATKNDSR